MRIVSVILTSQNGGAEQVFVDYLVALRNLGHDVLAVTKDDAPYVKQLEKLNIEVRKVKNNFGYYDLFAVKKIRDIVLEFDADITVSHMGRAVDLVRKALKGIKNKKILDVAVNHSMNVKRSVGADVVLSVNKQIFFKTIDAGQKESNSFVLPNAIDLSDISTDLSPSRLEDKDTIIIGAMARFDPSKGFDLVIKAVKKLQKLSDKNIILRIAGSGADEANLVALVKELELEDKVEFHGWVQDKKAFFEGLDIFCLPSINETFGLVLLEAMKYRRPIIVTNTDGANEFLQDRKDALVVDLDPLQKVDEKISQAVITMIENDGLTDELVDHAFTKVKERFSYKALEKNLKEIFGEAHTDS